jgi:CBS domain containing-hemolysin-like protein
LTTILLFVSIAAVVTAGFAAALAKAFEQLSLARLEELAVKRNKTAVLDAILASEERAALAAETFRVLFTVLAVAAMFGWLTDAWQNPLTAELRVVVHLLVFTIVLLAALVWVPATLVRVWAESLVLGAWPLWGAVTRALSPAFILMRGFEKVLRWTGGHPDAPSEEEELEEELKSIVTEGHREGLLEEDARDMIESVIELADVDVAEIMTPRTYMISLREDMPWDEMVKFVVDSGHTRIPVYGRTRDEIVGILHAKDVLAELARPSSELRTLEKILRQPYFVPETKKVDELLPEFQKSRNHIAIVLDEFGSVAGLVTIEDVIEEIVGEIADEYDEALVDGIKQTGDGTCEALARVRIGEVNERLGVSLPEDEDFDTIGGLLFHELGRIPDVGEELTYGDVRFRVLDASRRRIDRVAIEILRPHEDKAEAQAPSAEGSASAGPR